MKLQTFILVIALVYSASGAPRRIVDDEEFYDDDVPILFGTNFDGFANNLIKYVASIDRLNIPFGTIVSYMSSLDNLLSNRLGIPFFQETRAAVKSLIDDCHDDISSMDSKLEQMNLSETAKKNAMNLKANLKQFAESLSSIRDGKIRESPEIANQVISDFKKSLSGIASDSYALVQEGVFLNKLLAKTPYATTNLTKSLMKDSAALSPQYIASKLAMNYGLKLLPTGMASGLSRLIGLSGLSDLPKLTGSDASNGESNELSGLDTLAALSQGKTTLPDLTKLSSIINSLPSLTNGSLLPDLSQLSNLAGTINNGFSQLSSRLRSGFGYLTGQLAYM